MMAVENAPLIAEVLLRGGRDARTPVAVVCDGTMPTERTVLSTLGDLADDLVEHEVHPPAIIVIGEVVAVARPDALPGSRTRALSVATYVEIDDPADPRLADYRDLRDVQLRQSLEAEHGLFLAEGEKVVRRAAEAGFPVRSFLMAPRWLDGLADVLERTDAPCYVVTEALAEQVTGFHVHRGALASLARTPLPSVDEVLEGARTVVVCEDVVDHTNVGAIFRSAAALGVDAVLLAPRCADPLYRRSVKVAMGAVFALPWTRLPDWYDALPDLEPPRVPHGRPDPGRGRRPARGGGVRTRQVGAGGRVGRSWSVRALATLRRAPCGDPDAARASTPSTSRPRRRSPATSRRGGESRRKPEFPPIVSAWGGRKSRLRRRPATWSRRCPTTPSSGWTRRAPSPPGTSVPRSSRATPATRRSGAASRCSTPRRTGAPGCRSTLLMQARDEGRVEHLGWRVRKDGTRFWGDVIITALHDEAGRPHRLRQGHPRPHRAARPRDGPEVQRGAAAAAGRPGRRLRDHRARPPGHHRDLEPRRRAGQGLHRRGGRSAAASRCSTPRRTAAPACR